MKHETASYSCNNIISFYLHSQVERENISFFAKPDNFANKLNRPPRPYHCFYSDIATATGFIWYQQKHFAGDIYSMSDRHCLLVSSDKNIIDIRYMLVTWSYVCGHVGWALRNPNVHHSRANFDSKQ